jgi:hypothetical protein
LTFESSEQFPETLSGFINCNGQNYEDIIKALGFSFGLILTLHNQQLLDNGFLSHIEWTVFFSISI